MKFSSFFPFVATGLILCTSLSAQQYHDALAFGLKGNVKECKVVFAKDGSKSDDPHGFCSLSFSTDGKLDAIEMRSHPDCERRISDIVRSNGLLMGFKSEYESSYGFKYDYDFRFHYNGNELIGFYTRYSFGQKVAHGPGIKGYNVYSFLGSGKDSFNQESFDFQGVSFSDRFEAMIEEGFKNGGSFFPKLASVAKEIWDVYYEFNSSQTIFLIKSRDSHGNYTLLTDEKNGKSIKRIITYWDDKPASATTTQAAGKPSATPVTKTPETVKPAEAPKVTEKPVVASEPKKVEAPKPAVKDLQKEDPASKEAKSTGYRESTPKELSFDDIVTRPFGVLPKDRKKSTMEQILSDLANYDWKIIADNKFHSIELQKAGGYDMTILGEIPHSARSHFFGVKGNETELYSFSYAFIFKNHKQASQFAERLLSFLRAEGVELPDTSKYSNEVSAKYGNTLIEVKTPDKGQSYMSLNIGYWGGYWSNGEWKSGWIE